MADRKKLFYKDYLYQVNKFTESTVYYPCSKFGSGCVARLIKKRNEVTLKGHHSCVEDNISHQLEPPMANIDSKEIVNSFIGEKATKLELYPHQIYENLLLCFRQQFAGTIYDIPSKKFTYSKIKEIRGAMSVNSIQAITATPMRTLENGSPFFRRYWCGDIHGDYHQMLIWITDECLSLLRYNGHTFIDGTFRSAPAPFMQCVIIMTFDRGTLKYIPCCYALLTGKNEQLYCNLFHELVVLMEYNWMPSVITVDFEKSLISAVKHEFPQSRILGCFFHLKQALFRKLRKITRNSSFIHSTLDNIELLTVIPSAEISFGIQYIKSLNTIDNDALLFWTYFENTWMRIFNPSLWSLCNVEDWEIAGRTNNALERYNRRINDFFANSHPNLASFASTIKNEFKFYSEICNKIRQDSSDIRFGQGVFQRPAILDRYNQWRQQIN